MGKNAKRLRNVAKDLYQCVYDDIVNPRLTKMEGFVTEQLAKMAQQNNKIQGFLLGEVKFTIANELDDAKVTRESLIEILNEKLGVADLTALVNERKPVVRARLVKEAEDRMAKEQQEARERAEAAKAAQEAAVPAAESVPAAPAETPAEGATNGQN